MPGRFGRQTKPRCCRVPWCAAEAVKGGRVCAVHRVDITAKPLDEHDAAREEEVRRRIRRALEDR